jgi:hypothetical protein
LDIPLADKARFVAHNCELSKSEVQQLALKLAWIVLPIYEKKYIGDTRIRDCLIATEGYIAGTVTEEEFSKKRVEAYGAYYAAYRTAATAYYAAYFTLAAVANAAIAVANVAIAVANDVKSARDASSAYCAARAATGKPDYEQKVLNELKKLK